MAGAAGDAAGGAHDPPRLATGDEEGRTAAKRDMRVDGGARQHQPGYCNAVRTTFAPEWGPRDLLPRALRPDIRARAAEVNGRPLSGCSKTLLQEWLWVFAMPSFERP